MKYCPRCEEILPKIMFNKNKGRRDKLNGYCKECQAVCNREYQQTEKGQIATDRQNKSEAHKKASKKFGLKHSLIYRKTHKKEAKAQKTLAWLFARYINRNDFECAICGKQPIETHHENYDLWNVFIPLCKKCHLSIGVNFREK